GLSKFCQVGISIERKWRKAFNLHSNNHSGSFFLDDIRRIVSSFNPLGAISISISVVKPYLYSSCSSSFSNSSSLVLIFNASLFTRQTIIADLFGNTKLRYKY